MPTSNICKKSLNYKLLSHARMTVIIICTFISYVLPNHIHPFRAFYQELLSIVTILILTGLYAVEKFGHWPLVTPTVFVASIAFVISGQILLVQFVSNADALLPVSYLLITALAITLGAKFSFEVKGHAHLVNGLAAGYLVASTISSFIATLQLLRVESKLGALAVQMPHAAHQVIRVYANVSQPNQLALLFCMGVAAAWWFYQTQKIGIVGAGMLILVILWGLALTQSRIGWLIIPIYAACMLRWQKNITFRKFPPFAIGGMVAAYIAIVALLPRIAVLLGASVSSASERAQTGTERLSLYKQAWAMSWQHPLTGVGWFQFGPNQLKIANDFPPTTYAEHSHNIVLNLIAELGWPVGIAIVAATLWWCIASYRCKTKTMESGFSTLIFWAVGIHSMVEYPLWYAYVLIPTALLLGAAHQSQFGSRQITLPRWVPALVFAVMAVGIVAVATDYRRLVLGFRALGFENLGMVADEGSTNMPLFTMFPQFYDYFKLAKTRAHAGMTPAEIAALEHTASRFGYAPVLMRMTMVYALNGREDDAIKTMETLRRLHPENYPEAYQSWKQMSAAQPALYAAAFRKFTPPGSDQAVQKKGVK